MNSFSITGNLSTETFYTKSTEDDKRDRCWFMVAVDGHSKDSKTDFLPVVTFGARARACAEHLYKGKEVRIQGRLGSYRQLDENGEPVGNTVVNLIASNVEFGRDTKKKMEEKQSQSRVSGKSREEIAAGIYADLISKGVLSIDKLKEVAGGSDAKEAEASPASLPDDEIPL